MTGDSLGSSHSVRAHVAATDRQNATLSWTTDKATHVADHYVSSGDTCARVHSACAAGDIDGFWDALTIELANGTANTIKEDAKFQ